MHKQHEDQPSNNLPDLSTWHRVPTGAVIPKNTPYAFTYNGGIMVKLGGYSLDITMGRDDGSYYMEHPVTPLVPTEEGATIMASGNKLPPHVLLTCVGGGWFDRYGDKWVFDDITAWAPVTIGDVVVMP